MKPKRQVNHLTRNASITARYGKLFAADPSQWNADQLYAAARAALRLALTTLGYREPVTAIPVRLIEWDAASGVHQYAMSDGSVRSLNVTEALRLKNMLGLAAEIGRVFSDEPPLRADLLSEFEDTETRDWWAAYYVRRAEREAAWQVRKVALLARVSGREVAGC